MNEWMRNKKSQRPWVILCPRCTSTSSNRRKGGCVHCGMKLYFAGEYMNPNEVAYMWRGHDWIPMWRLRIQVLPMIKKVAEKQRCVVCRKHHAMRRGQQTYQRCIQCRALHCKECATQHYLDYHHTTRWQQSRRLENGGVKNVEQT